jgi:TIR domain
MDRTKIFLGYAHEDESWKDLLVLHLAVLERQGLVHVWADTRIQIGADWQMQIQKALDDSQVAVLLISPNFLRSEFILNSEVPTLIQAHAERGMKVLPIIIRPCAWRIVDWLSKRQVRPKNGRAIALVDNAQADVDLTAIIYEIAAMVSHVSVELATDEIALAQKESRRTSAIRPEITEQGNSVRAFLDIDAAFASLERLAHNFKLEQSNSDVKLAQFVEAALRHGVAMFNGGSPVACAVVYLHAAQLLRDSLLPYLPPMTLERRKNTLTNLPEMEAITADSAPTIAWQLRHMLDAVTAA